ncbi:hypothetical protein P2Q00_49890 [Streptomyces coacervatus]|uniref:hypothetical protein n=1 Tax=Streptomyces coacervatus TaxID=647381 RepID=UPI0023DC5E17|nr:hypothetical protein [Streptomyces coacervatus]MDF2273444.1 hypothetical protein [Streptomyces coacervatus]
MQKQLAVRDRLTQRDRRGRSLVAGIAYDDGALRLDEPVSESVDLPEFSITHRREITWRHLLARTGVAACGAAPWTWPASACGVRPR